MGNANTKMWLKSGACFVGLLAVGCEARGWNPTAREVGELARVANGRADDFAYSATKEVAKNDPKAPLGVLRPFFEDLYTVTPTTPAGQTRDAARDAYELQETCRVLIATATAIADDKMIPKVSRLLKPTSGADFRSPLIMIDFAKAVLRNTVTTAIKVDSEFESYAMKVTAKIQNIHEKLEAIDFKGAREAFWPAMTAARLFERMTVLSALGNGLPEVEEQKDIAKEELERQLRADSSEELSSSLPTSGSSSSDDEGPAERSSSPESVPMPWHDSQKSTGPFDRATSRVQSRPFDRTASRAQPRDFVRSASRPMKATPQPFYKAFNRIDDDDSDGGGPFPPTRLGFSSDSSSSGGDTEDSEEEGPAIRANASILRRKVSMGNSAFLPSRSRDNPFRKGYVSQVSPTPPEKHADAETRRSAHEILDPAPRRGSRPLSYFKEMPIPKTPFGSESGEVAPARRRSSYFGIFSRPDSDFSNIPARLPDRRVSNAEEKAFYRRSTAAFEPTRASYSSLAKPELQASAAKSKIQSLTRKVTESEVSAALRSERFFDDFVKKVVPWISLGGDAFKDLRRELAVAFREAKSTQGRVNLNKGASGYNRRRSVSERIEEQLSDALEKGAFKMTQIINRKA